MPMTGRPFSLTRAHTSESTWGESGSYTELGPPERMMPMTCSFWGGCVGVVGGACVFFLFICIVICLLCVRWPRATPFT